MERLAAALAIMAVAAAGGGCGEKGEPEGGTPPANPPEVPAGAEEVVLQAVTGGGYVPVVDMRREFPAAVLHGDGRLVTAIPGDPEDEAAVPELRVSHLDDAEVGEIVLAAQDAGVGEDVDYGAPDITDLPTTTVTLRTEDGTEEASAYGLGFDDADSGVSGDQEEARRELSEFIDSLLDRTGEPFDPAAYVVTSIASGAVGEGGLRWPLEPERFASGKRSEVCTIVEGGDAEKLARAAADATEEELWVSHGTRAEVAIRPAIGLEDGCPEGVPEA